MTPEQLKGSIIQFAIEGKLVEQLDSDSDVDNAIKEMEEERTKLIREGNLKKEGKINKTADTEIDIPNSWRLVPLRNLVCKRVDNRGKTPPHALMKNPNECIDLLEIASIIPGKSINHNKVEKYVSEETYNSQRGFIEKDDILIATVGSIGKFALMDDIKSAVAQNIIAIKCFDKVDQHYIFYLLQSPYFYSAMGCIKMEAVQASIKVPDLMNLKVPLPPIEEQHRIVAKIEELLPFVDRYATSYEKLEKFSAKFPEDMKKSILQYAIQGKLVEQRPEEGTAEELYQQIQKEKEKLIKEKKIKKEKPLDAITEDEIPFDIPESWKWCYIGDLFLHNTGKAQNSSGSTDGTVRKFITTSNLYWNEFDFTKVKEMPFTEKELERCTVQKGDLLVCEGGDCGRSAVWNYDEEVCIQNHVHRLRPYQEMDIYYFYYIFYLYKTTGKLRGRGVAIQGLSNEAIHKVMVPLPPFEEQKRIVAKIEELLPFCDRLIK